MVNQIISRVGLTGNNIRRKDQDIAWVGDYAGRVSEIDKLRRHHLPLKFDHYGR